MEYTSRIYDRLVQSFGTESIFRDIDSIPLGIAFPELLKQTLSRTGVVLVIIGPTWLSVTNTQGQRRLFECGDLVCMEVETALHLDLAVIPVVVANAQMPRESDLPDSIRELALRNGFAVRPDPDFHRDMDRLCSKVQEFLGIADRAALKTALMEQMLAKYQAELEREERERQLKIAQVRDAETRRQLQFAQARVEEIQRELHREQIRELQSKMEQERQKQEPYERKIQIVFAIFFFTCFLLVLIILIGGRLQWHR